MFNIILNMHSSQPCLNPPAPVTTEPMPWGMIPYEQNLCLSEKLHPLILKASTRMLFAWGLMQKLRDEEGGSLTYSSSED